MVEGSALRDKNQGRRGRKGAWPSFWANVAIWEGEPQGELRLGRASPSLAKIRGHTRRKVSFFGPIPFFSSGN
jgi:hypothetical protein